MIKFKLIISIALLSLSFNIKAQVSNSANFIKGGESDVVKIVSAYLMPVEQAVLFNGANNNMLMFKHKNNDNFNYGLGIDLTASFVNSNDYTYDVNELNLEGFEVANPNNTIAQTASGSEETIVLQTKDKYKIPSFSYPFYTNQAILSLNSPKGTSSSYIPYALIHLFVEKNGNLINVKVLPPIKINDNAIGLFNMGIYVQHNLETSIAFLKDFPIDLYVSGGFNYNRIIMYLDIKPDEEGLTFSTDIDNESYDNQELQMHSKSIPIRLIVLKPYNDFSFFVSAGYNMLNSLVRMLGNYPIYSSDPSNQFNIVAFDVKDPFEYSRGFNNFSATAGVNYRTNHLNITLSFNYSYYKNVAFSIAYIL